MTKEISQKGKILGSFEPKTNLDDTISDYLKKFNEEYYPTSENKACDENKYAVLLVDMQEYFLETIEEEKRKSIIQSQINVLEHCARKDIPLAEIKFNKRGESLNQLQPYILNIPRSKQIWKFQHNAFSKPELNISLEKWNIKNVCIMGVYSSACVKATAEGALRHKYHIATSDALIADNYDYNQEIVIEWFKRHGKHYDDHKDLIKQMDLNYNSDNK